MSPGATFERVYRALKVELGSGRFRPGDHLEPSALSDELNSSITPVRDALHRLVGENLVEAPRGDGFRMPLVTEVALRHLYAWNQWLLLGAIRARRDTRSSETARGPSNAQASTTIDALFLGIAAFSGNPEHVGAMARVNDRLRAVRLVEQSVIDGADDELDEIRRATENPPELRRLIIAYHRRRLRAAAEVVARTAYDETPIS